MTSDKRTSRRWLDHKRELCGPDGSAAVLARRIEQKWRERRTHA